ncbi:MAG: AzlC family ABC transporter permease [Erysipelotrichaceae bacterium]|nr:AzlC family ABC transporter permease [Erysipelotrichaceae bacterium]
MKSITKYALKQALPITCSYLFVSFAYGIMMQEAGLNAGWSLLTSLSVYTGAFQFVLVALLSSGASFFTIALTALFMNSRQVFYGLSFTKDFPHMGKKYWYMVHTLTDETYAVNCALEQKKETEELLQDDENRRNIMFLVAIFSRISWMIGAVLGGILGQLIPFELEGIDFCMTALFVVIFIDQWKACKDHVPALLGIGIGILLLLCLGQDVFMLPTLILVSGILIVLKEGKERE